MRHTEHVGIAQQLIVQVALELQIVEPSGTRRLSAAVSQPVEMALDNLTQILVADPEETRHVLRWKEAAQQQVKLPAGRPVLEERHPHPVISPSNDAPRRRTPHQSLSGVRRAAREAARSAVQPPVVAVTPEDLVTTEPGQDDGETGPARRL